MGELGLAWGAVSFDKLRMILGLGGRPHPNPPPEGEGICCVG